MKKVGIYDSGCGGFSVVNQLIEQGFTGELYYYGDSLNNPWGNKSKTELFDILIDISTWFKSNNIDCIFSGCNTTLSLFKENLTTIFDIPVFNILENTEKYYSKEKYSVLATENSHKNKLFTNFLSNKIIQEIPCEGLANLIENNKQEEALNVASNFIEKTKYSTVILGCTHYPLIIKKLKDKFPNKTFIDPAKYLESSNLFKEKLSTPKYIFKTSGNNEKFNSMIQNHLKLDKYKLNSTIYNNVEPILDNVS